MQTNELISDFAQKFNFLLKSEQNKLKEERMALEREKIDFYQDKKQQLEMLEHEKRQWQETKEKVEKMYHPPSNIIDLDVGGTHKITTTLSTL